MNFHIDFEGNLKDAKV
jgi:hypothetical protein